MKKLLLYCFIMGIMISMIATFSLIGCKAKTTETTAAAETTVAAETTATTAAAEEIKVTEKVSITLWCMAFDPHVNGYNNVISGFQKKYPNITVVLEPQPGQAELTAKMRSSLVSGKGADIFTTPGTTITEWVIPGNLQPLSPGVVTTEFVKKEMLPENYIQCHIDEQIWAIGIPDPPGDSGFIVNVDDIKAAGLELPKKFDSINQLMDYAKKLSKYDADGKLVHGGLSFQESNDPMFFYSYIVDAGGKFWDNETQKFTLQTPETKKVMNFFHDLFDTYKVDSVELPDSMSALTQGLTSMAFMWPEFLPFAKTAYPDLNFGFIGKPAFVEGKLPVMSHTDTWNAVMPKYVEGIKKDAAFLFLKYLASEEGQLLFLDANPGLSPLKSLVFKNDYYVNGKGAYLAPVIESIKAGQYRFWGPFIDADVMLYDILWPNIDAIIHDQISVDDGLAKMETELNDQNTRTRAKYPNAEDTIIKYEGFGEEFGF
ncbi:MAG: extracellular solute-binding protein [Actinobacteria bacterium]|nr:extracellular solute-binding protein [Actinomycetota bacterium]